MTTSLILTKKEFCHSSFILANQINDLILSLKPDDRFTKEEDHNEPIKEIFEKSSNRVVDILKSWRYRLYTYINFLSESDFDDMKKIVNDNKDMIEKLIAERDIIFTNLEKNVNDLYYGKDPFLLVLRLIPYDTLGNTSKKMKNFLKDEKNILEEYFNWKEKVTASLSRSPSTNVREAETFIKPIRDKMKRVNLNGDLSRYSLNWNVNSSHIDSFMYLYPYTNHFTGIIFSLMCFWMYDSYIKHNTYKPYKLNL